MQNFTAYITPDAMNLIIVSVAGVAVSLGAAIVVYVRRAKHKISEKLGIDENRNKEVEGEVTGSFGEDK